MLTARTLPKMASHGLLPVGAHSTSSVLVVGGQLTKDPLLANTCLDSTLVQGSFHSRWSHVGAYGTGMVWVAEVYMCIDSDWLSAPLQLGGAIN